ncbi:cellulose biosynthesis protein BcsP [Paraburkholderia sp. J12]|uniref:cellulose biosynthesis protein BcsP n=1 Tax=Paraburkholderia sp. J12 TaxID=2805432 RepID=UPI002ABE35E1|nr:cellulose biosynthesis protein BcsP [Paraburkholderia sp. J12]
MSTSRDIKALFDRFGGDSSSYREIRMEGEAHEARGRWPLLGMIDPRKVELDALDAARRQGAADPVEPEAGEAGEDAGTGSVFAPPRAGGGLLPRDRSQAALRRSAPLFTRSPRRDIPPVLQKSQPKAPESAAFRFSPTPSMEARADAMPQQPEPGTAASIASPEATAPAPRVAPRGAALPPLTGRPAMTAPAIAPRTAPVASAPLAAGPVASAAANLAAPNRPLATSTRSSPLRKLIGAAPAASLESAPPIQAPGTDGRLDSLFGRLRGTAQAPRLQAAGVEPKAAAAPRRPWFLKGVGRP